MEEHATQNWVPRVDDQTVRRWWIYMELGALHHWVMGCLDRRCQSSSHSVIYTEPMTIKCSKCHVDPPTTSAPIARSWVTMVMWSVIDMHALMQQVILDEGSNIMKVDRGTTFLCSQIRCARISSRKSVFCCVTSHTVYFLNKQVWTKKSRRQMFKLWGVEIFHQMSAEWTANIYDQWNQKQNTSVSFFSIQIIWFLGQMH